MQTILTQTMQEAAQSLIENLIASDPFIHHQQARNRLNQDMEARLLLDQFSLSQATMRKKQVDGAVTQLEIDSLRELQQKVQHNRIIMDHAQSQQEAINFLREVNDEISQLLGINFASFANHATC